MSFELRLARQAARYLERLDMTTPQRIMQRLDDISVAPLGPHSKALRNAHGMRSARVGSYRIIYSVDQEKQLIDVTLIGPRGRVYCELN